MLISEGVNVCTNNMFVCTQVLEREIIQNVTLAWGKIQVYILHTERENVQNVTLRGERCTGMHKMLLLEWENEQNYTPGGEYYP